MSFEFFSPIWSHVREKMALIRWAVFDKMGFMDGRTTDGGRACDDSISAVQ